MRANHYNTNVVAAICRKSCKTLNIVLLNVWSRIHLVIMCDKWGQIKKIFTPSPNLFVYNKAKLVLQFDIPLWLSATNPAQIEMKRLIDILGIALYSCGLDPDKPHSLVVAVSITLMF